MGAQEGAPSLGWGLELRLSSAKLLCLGKEGGSRAGREAFWGCFGVSAAPERPGLVAAAINLCSFGAVGAALLCDPFPSAGGGRAAAADAELKGALLMGGGGEQGVLGAPDVKDGRRGAV